MGTILPPIPNFIFAICEPISLLAGFIVFCFSPSSALSGQTPWLAAPPAHAASTLVTIQLGNLYLLLGMVGLSVLYTSSEPKVIRNYIIALALADIGHVYVTYLGMGWDRFVDVGAWNAIAIGNIGITAGLFVFRCLFLTGVFGGYKNAGRGGVKKTV